MSDEPATNASDASSNATKMKRGPRWLAVAAVASLVLHSLDYLLGLVIWLPFYSGLFGYLLAGLIAGGTAFRLARTLRPVTRSRIILFSILMATANAPFALYWEYHHVAEGVAGLAGFRKLRARAARDNTPIKEVNDRINDEFRSQLASLYPPGRMLGYARWCIASGEMVIEVGDASDTVFTDHQGWVWLVRSIIAYVLSILGLVFSFDGLRSMQPISNVLAPGEEYEELDD
ncbi:MAG: hypothetical protein KF841_05155 [Phycisphaerae bacterium]|nr:hypothetical protein [Phycisphaerae bacterium]